MTLLFVCVCVGVILCVLFCVWLCCVPRLCVCGVCVLYCIDCVDVLCCVVL